MDIILNRRSVRKYTDEPVTDNQLNAILRAAMRAPSATNQQPWEFVVVKDKAMLARLAQVSPYVTFLADAPCAIVVCSSEAHCKCPEYAVQDCAAATENMLLEATYLRLGAVWMGIAPIEQRMTDTAALLGLPQEVSPFSIVAVGHPADTPAPMDTFNPQRIHIEQW